MKTNMHSDPRNGPTHIGHERGNPSSIPEAPITTHAPLGPDSEEQAARDDKAVAALRKSDKRFDELCAGRRARCSSDHHADLTFLRILADHGFDELQLRRAFRRSHRYRTIFDQLCLFGDATYGDILIEAVLGRFASPEGGA